VRHAFALLSDVPTRLVAFSDDMDGLRKVPDNIPNRKAMERFTDQPPHYGGVPLTSIPDPFGCCESYGHHNNEMLRGFLDRFGVDYEFKSATECYTSGVFDHALRNVLEHYSEILEVAERTVRPERRKNYGLFLPKVGDPPRYVYVRPDEIRPDLGTIVFTEPTNRKRMEVSVTGGNCKPLWRIDWAMRWYAFEVDYEMSGKDLIDSVKLSNQVCRILGGTPPINMTYELFLDENGEKISKSKGNGLTIEEWLTYGPRESLALFMFHSPRKAKRLYFDVIPRHVDDYLGLVEKYPEQTPEQKLANPVWHIHAGNPPEHASPLAFNILLNLASVCNTEDKAVLWGFVGRYVPGATPASHPFLDQLIGHAAAYFRDFVKPAKRYRAAADNERMALADLAETLARLAAGAAAETIQHEVYEVGKRHGFSDLRAWFKALYEILLGQSEGPRMGSFIAVYGPDEMVALIRRAAAGETLHAAQAPALRGGVSR